MKIVLFYFHLVSYQKALKILEDLGALVMLLEETTMVVQEIPIQ